MFIYVAMCSTSDVCQTNNNDKEQYRVAQWEMVDVYESGRGSTKVVGGQHFGKIVRRLRKWYGVYESGRGQNFG